MDLAGQGVDVVMTDGEEEGLGAEYEGLAVRRLAEGFAAAALPIVNRVRRSWPALSDQLDRAVDSAVLNVGEAIGEYRPAEKARIYRIARRSVSEAENALALLAIKGIEPAESLAPCRAAARRLGIVLVHHCRAMQRRASSDRP